MNRGYVNVKNIGKANKIINLSTRCRNNIKKFEQDIVSLSELSVLLLSPLKDIIDTKGDIIVIPDTKLQGFPFEVLLFDPKWGDEKKNLIVNFNITYAPSLSELLQRNVDHDKTSKFDFIGFAPGSFSKGSRNDITDLPLSLTEVDRISDLFQSNSYHALTFTEQLASLPNLLEYGNQTKILHFATHSKPAPLFSSTLLLSPSQVDESLSSVEYFDIIASNISPQVVVLSCCNTFQGTSYQGEGIINLSRAFLLNGTSSVIYSLFNTEEHFANEFMYRFYLRYIKSGNITWSVNETKREYLNHPVYSNPLFWTNFNIMKR